MSDCGHDPLMVQALVDGELDAVHAAEVEASIAACEVCTAEQARLLALRAALRGEGARMAAPARLHQRLAESLAAAPVAPAPPAPRLVASSRPRPSGLLLAGGGGMALAACFALAFVMVDLRQDNLVVGELVDSHERSLQLDHLTDVVTSDQHVVKPWFNGKLDFAPPVFDLKDQGFPLVGGRLDHVDGKTVAAIVFRRGRHVINLFVWPGAGGGPEHRRVAAGYDLRRWRSGGMTFWAVSDVNPADLAQFETLMRARTGE